MVVGGDEWVSGLGWGWGCGGGGDVGRWRGGEVGVVMWVAGVGWAAAAVVAIAEVVVVAVHSGEGPWEGYLPCTGGPYDRRSGDSGGGLGAAVVLDGRIFEQA